jgi:hypothetical protein
MQSALQTEKGGRIALHRGVHQALKDFRWIANDIASRPTRIQEIIPLNPSAMGDHDASGDGAGGVWFPTSTIDSRINESSPLILWRFEWPQEIKDQLVTEDNPTGTISNSDLELAGGLLHLEAATQCLDVRERTLLSRTDNLLATQRFSHNHESTIIPSPPVWNTSTLPSLRPTSRLHIWTFQPPSR